MIDGEAREEKIKQIHAIFEAYRRRLADKLALTEPGKPVSVYSGISDVGRSWIESHSHPLLTRDPLTGDICPRMDVISPVINRGFKNFPWRAIYAQEFVDMFRSTGHGHYKMQLRADRQGATTTEITFIETTGCIIDSDSKVSSTRVNCFEYFTAEFPGTAFMSILIDVTDAPFGIRISCDHNLAVSIWHMFSGTKEIIRS